jgi:Flp pilus assembly protein TadG
MSRHKSHKLQRKGAIAILVAIFSVGLFGMVAFAVDIAWIASTKARLQAAADAAAEAGARQLIEGYVLFNFPLATGKDTIIANAEASARSYAKTFAGYNGAGEVGSLTLNDSDIEFGYTNSAGVYAALSGSNVYPNTCKVTLRRDSSANGALTLFFAPVLGTSSTTLTATATAVIYTSTSVTNFNTGAGINGGMLPVALDINAWTTFYATGQSPDGVVHIGANGLPQLKVYPTPANAPGNFGLLSIGEPSSATPSYRNWIGYGPSPADMQYLNDNNLVPVSASSPQPWVAGPGMKSTLEGDFAGVANLPRLMPLFQPVSTSPYQAAASQGSNAYYNIVGFAGVKITEATGNGNNMNISVQPAAEADATVNYDPTKVVPAGEGSAATTTTTFILPKLVQ